MIANRSFIRLMAILCSLLFLPIPPFAQAPSTPHQTIHFDWDNEQDKAELDNIHIAETGLQLASQNQSALFTSAPVTVPLQNISPFIAFSAAWTFDHTATAAPILQVRGSTDAIHWADWQDLKKDEHGPTVANTTFSQLLFLDADFAFIQIKIALSGQSTGNFQTLDLHFFNPGMREEAAIPVERPVAEQRNLCTCPAPPVSGRDVWCPDGNCPPNPNPDPTTITHLIIHHSATDNNASNWPAVVRSIWDFHVNTWGWSDIGYNWLIDPTGKLYEGRGQSIQGAHFCGTNAGTTGICMLGTYQIMPPSNATQQTLQQFLSWQSCLADIDPLGTALHASSELDLFHISGHRDGCNTECPGNEFYPLIGGIRQGVQNFIDNNCSVVSNTPAPDYIQTQVAIFPNPNNGTFQIEHDFEELGELSLFNTQGQTVMQKTRITGPLTSIKASHLTPGIYWAQVIFGENTIYRKLIIQ